MLFYSFYTNDNELLFSTNSYELSMNFFDNYYHGNFCNDEFYEEEEKHIVYYEYIIIEISK